MTKNELKELVKRYFNLTEKQSTEDIVKEEATFASAKLIDGTEITNMKDSEFAEGDEVHVITAEGEHVLAPSGEHELESGIVLTIDGAGVITGIKRPGEEGEGSLEAKEHDMAEETLEKTEMAEHGDEVVAEESMEEDAIKEAIVEAIAEVVAPEIEAMKAKMAAFEETIAGLEEGMKKHMSKPATQPTSESRFSKKSIETNNKPRAVYNVKRYEAALAKVTNL